VNTDIGHHSFADELVLDEGPDQLDLLLLGQLPWEGNFDLAGELRIPALLRPLDHVPERLSIERPRRGVVGSDYFLVDDIGLVEREPFALGRIV
jgi:hypothetical protein